MPKEDFRRLGHQLIDWIADYFDHRAAAEEFDLPHEHQRAKDTFVLVEAGRTVDYPEFPCSRFEFGTENVGVSEITLFALVFTDRGDGELATDFCVQQRSEDE